MESLFKIQSYSISFISVHSIKISVLHPSKGTPCLIGSFNISCWYILYLRPRGSHIKLRTHWGWVNVFYFKLLLNTIIILNIWFGVYLAHHKGALVFSLLNLQKSKHSWISCLVLLNFRPFLIMSDFFRQVVMILIRQLGDCVICEVQSSLNNKDKICTHLIEMPTFNGKPSEIWFLSVPLGISHLLNLQISNTLEFYEAV